MNTILQTAPETNFSADLLPALTCIHGWMQDRYPWHGFLCKTSVEKMQQQYMLMLRPGFFQVRLSCLQ